MTRDQEEFKIRDTAVPPVLRHLRPTCTESALDHSQLDHLYLDRLCCDQRLSGAWDMPEALGVMALPPGVLKAELLQ